MAERIVLRGRSELLKPVITELLAMHQLIDNRDVGQIIGRVVASDEKIRAKPMPLMMTIQWSSIAEPPFNKAKTEASYDIPDVKRSALDWEKIKQVAGGANGYMWGRFRATAQLSNQRQMQVYGATGEEAEERLLAMATLSEATIETLTTAEEKKVGRRAKHKKLYKETTRVYPAYVSFLHQEKLLGENDAGVATLQGIYAKSDAKLPLWTSTKPYDFEARIQEMLRVRGSV